MNLTLKDLKTMPGAALMPGAGLTRRKFIGVSTDTRTIRAGEVFFALRGESFDGHRFILTAIEKGAAAIVVDRTWLKQNEAIVSPYAGFVVGVPDTLAALGSLGRMYRRKFSIPVLAVGGSNGKTTTKDMIAAVLKKKYTVLKTEGNLNNQIGVPQTLFRLNAQHDMAVIEIGTNHFGEVKYLAELVEPTHAVLTTIGREHLEFFGDLEGVANEEFDLFRTLKALGGFAFINIDDAFLVKGKKFVAKHMTYGRSARADVSAKNIRVDSQGMPRFEIVRAAKKKNIEISLSVAGIHNVTNALAAAAVGTKFSVPSASIAAALKEFIPSSKRMEQVTKNGITILNDTYNANPDSVLAALRTLKAMTVTGKKIVVLGDMLELGSSSESEHARIGKEIARMGFQWLFAYGPMSRKTVDASQLSHGGHWSSKPELIASLKQSLSAGDGVLVKGSRGMKMEEVVSQL